MGRTSDLSLPFLSSLFSHHLRVPSFDDYATLSLEWVYNYSDIKRILYFLEVLCPTNLCSTPFLFIFVTLKFCCRIPIVGGRELDLHRLFVEVTSRGGIAKVRYDYNFYCAGLLFYVLKLLCMSNACDWWTGFLVINCIYFSQRTERCCMFPLIWLSDKHKFVGEFNLLLTKHLLSSILFKKILCCMFFVLIARFFLEWKYACILFDFLAENWIICTNVLNHNFLFCLVVVLKVIIFGLSALQIVKERKWKDVTSVFNFPSTATNASFVLRKYYASLLYHYEQIYFFKAREWDPTASGISFKPHCWFELVRNWGPF